MFFLSWAEQRDPCPKACGGAGVSWVTRDLLHGNLNHHCYREQVCQPLSSLQAAPPHPTPTAQAREQRRWNSPWFV